MTDGISDAYDTRLRCPKCYHKSESYELLEVNNRLVCPHCKRIMFDIILLEKTVIVTYKEQVDFSNKVLENSSNEKLKKLLNDGYSIVGYV